MSVRGGDLYTVFLEPSNGEGSISLWYLCLKLFYLIERARIGVILTVGIFVVPVYTNGNGLAPKWTRHN